MGDTKPFGTQPPMKDRAPSESMTMTNLKTPRAVTATRKKRMPGKPIVPQSKSMKMLKGKMGPRRS